MEYLYIGLIVIFLAVIVAIAMTLDKEDMDS
jgi:hypothetical protein